MIAVTVCGCVCVAITAVMRVRRLRPGGVAAHADRAQGVTVAELRQRVYNDVWPQALTHSAPRLPLTVPEAHRDMRRHLDCDFRRCARKAVAWRTLREARVRA
jgi:hypothetical protein